MSIETTIQDDPDRWNELVERSPQTTPFHRYEALEVMASHSGSTLYPYCGYKGEQPVGLFPVFGLSRGPIRAALSPPPDLKINYLGPALLYHETLKRRKAEKRHRLFVEGVEAELGEEIGPQYVHVRTGPAYTDPRPFLWNGFELTPEYTYHVDLRRGSDELFMHFSGDLRTNVRRGTDIDHEIHEGDAEDVERVIRRVESRHREQGVDYPMSPAFARDLYEALPEGTMRVTVCRADGSFLGGKITLENDDVLFDWQSAHEFDHELEVSDLVIWHLLQQATERGLERCDLCGANNPRLCSYKAKFNPTLRTYYTIERANVVVDGLKNIYRRYR